MGGDLHQLLCTPTQIVTEITARIFHMHVVRRTTPIHRLVHLERIFATPTPCDLRFTFEGIIVAYKFNPSVFIDVL